MHNTASTKLRSYELSGQKYFLPPPTLVKQLTTGISGNLDTWPAHATGRQETTSQVILTKENRLVVINDKEIGRTSLVPKPRFLEQLEGYLQRELTAHNVTEINPNSVRLQIHREVFEYLIEAFRTYRPLLASIKREYEMTIENYQKEIQQLEPMREMLWTLSEEHEKKIMELRDEEKEEIKSLKFLNRTLHEKIDSLKEDQKGLECQLDKLTNELELEHHKYRDEADSRKLLVADLNEMRSQQEDLHIFKKNAAKDEEEQEDPVQMRISLNMAKKGQSEAVKKLNEMIANYSDVIPRKDYETLQQNYSKIEEEFDTFKVQLDKIQDEYRILQSTYDEVIKQRDQYAQEVDSLRRSATPRPDWQKVAENIYGGLERWNEISADKSSDQLVDVLLLEMSGANAGGSDTGHLEGMGMGVDVPKFLRHEGSVPNRRMTKRDTRIHVREIFDDRKFQKDEQAQAIEKGQAMIMAPIGDFLDIFFRKIYGIEQIRLEWAYSFYDALGRFAADEKIAQFLGILRNQVDEECYWDEMRHMGTVLDHFKAQDFDKSGVFNKETINRVLASLYTQFDEEVINKLVDLLIAELDPTGVAETYQYDKLFLCDDEGEFGLFLKEVRRIYYEEKHKYIEDIQKELFDLTTDRVSVDDIRRAIAIVDPEIEKFQLESYIFWVFNVRSNADLAACEAMEIVTVIERLKNGNIKRIGKRL